MLACGADMRTRLSVLGVGLLATVLGAAPATPASSQEPGAQQPAADLLQQLDTLQGLMSVALIEFNGEQQSRSIVMFEEIISTLARLRLTTDLPENAEQMLLRSYELRARAFFNIGSESEARESFRQLIRVRPDYALNEEEVSPKLVTVYNSVKESLVGYLAVSSFPAGAEVKLNGALLSLTDFFPLEVLVGEYQIEISREGYATETQALAITATETQALEVELTRTAASLFFITEPAGVEIWVDGEHEATTGGSLAADMVELASLEALDPGRASAIAEVANVDLGSHEIEFRKRCYEPLRTTLNAEEPRDYQARPVRMAPSLGTLMLTSDPPGAQIFIDGEPMGRTPRELDGICSGKHRLEVKHTSGKFVQDLELQKNETLSLDCPIRPSLAFLGVVVPNAAAERVEQEVRDQVIRNLSGIRTLNFMPVKDADVERVLDAERTALAQLVPGAGAEPDVIRRVTERLAEGLEVQGFLFAELEDQQLQRRATLHLLAAGNAATDQYSVIFNQSASYISFLSSIDRRATVYRPWTGLITIDTLSHDGVPVLRVVPGSPAARAQVKVEEILFAADGQPVKKTSELLERVAGKRAGDRLTLQLRGSEGARTVELELQNTPQEVPLNDPDLLYNKVMMDLRQQVEGYPGTEQAAFARLNLAICSMHFDDFAAAHEHLLKARRELPAGPGISQGTALYYLGLSLERLGYEREARDSYQAAAGFEEATLFNNDGPRVAPLAARRARP